jgi:Flp pilus assembly protein TadD
MRFISLPLSRHLLMLALLQGVACSVNQVVVDAPSVSADARANFASAVASMQQQQWLAAEQRLLELRRQYPGYSGAALNLGIVYLHTDRLRQAEQAFRSAIALNPANIDAYNHLGAMLRQAGRFADAREQYEAALAIVPGHGETHLNLGILCDLYLGELVTAKRHYEAYQSAQAEPDRQVSGWLLDLERRQTQLSQLEGAR